MGVYLVSMMKMTGLAPGDHHHDSAAMPQDYQEWVEEVRREKGLVWVWNSSEAPSIDLKELRTHMRPRIVGKRVIGPLLCLEWFHDKNLIQKGKD